MYSSVDIAYRIKRIAEKRKIQLINMYEELHINKNTLTNLYNGSMIKSDTLARIADYLNCSVDYLLGRSNQENIDQNVYTLTAEEQTLINKFRKLPPNSQHSILDYLSYFESTLINESDISIQSDININNNLLQTTNNQSNPDNDDSINKN